jgi:hypothetical protein
MFLKDSNGECKFFLKICNSLKVITILSLYSKEKNRLWLTQFLRLPRAAAVVAQ